MKKITVTICTGTACFVMGASELMLLPEKIPADLKDKVDFSACMCMEECHVDSKKVPPFVKINGELMEKANVPDVIEKLYALVGQEN